MNPPKAFNELMNRLLSEEDRNRFEWAIGAMLVGIHPNVVTMIGPPQSGKTTLMAIARKVLTRFEGQLSPRVAFLHTQMPKFPYVDEGTFVFLDDTVEPIAESTLVIHTSARHPIPVNKYHVLMGLIESELDWIAEVCITKYRSMGEDYYRVEEETG